MDTEPRSSGLGLASILVFLASLLVGLPAILLGVIIGRSPHRPSYVMVSVGAMFIISGLIAGGLLNLAAWVLGVAGLCQQGRRKTLAVWGTVLSSLVLVAMLVVVLLVIGRLAGGRAV